MRPLSITTAVVAVALFTLSASAADKIDFAKDIQPIIKSTCVECHNPKKVKGKLRLDNKADAMKGGKEGKDIVPGKADDSLMYKLLIAKDPDDRMPQDKDPLPAAQIEKIKQWINQGAPWPDGVTITPPAK
jgi:hypothetical protein